MLISSQVTVRCWSTHERAAFLQLKLEVVSLGEIRACEDKAFQTENSGCRKAACENALS